MSVISGRTVAKVGLLLFFLIQAYSACALTSKQREQVYSLSPPLMHPVSPSQTIDTVDWLHSQIVTAELMNRDDIVESALDRLLAVSPNDLNGQIALVRLSARKNQLRQAKLRLNLLRVQHSAKNTVLLLESYLSIYTNKRSDYKRLQLLEKLGRTEEAIASYDALFPYGMPTHQLWLAYLSLLGEDDSNWALVKDKLEQMNYHYPNVPILQLRLASHLRTREPDNPWMLETLQRLAANPQVGERAAKTWLKALSDLPVDAEWAKQHVILASYFPYDFAIQQANLAAQSRWKQEQEWLRDPTYRAKLKGIALVKSDDPEKLSYAYEQLSYAMTTRPNDPQLLEAMGKYYLRQGQSEQALLYFKRAAYFDEDPDNTTKYQSLVRTAQYWTYLDRGDQLVVEGSGQEAKEYYNKAQGLLPDNPQSYIRQASLALLENDYLLASARYRKGKQKDPLNAAALRGILNTYVMQRQPQIALQQAGTFTPAQQQLVRKEIDTLKIEQLARRLDTYSNSQNNQRSTQQVIDQLVQINPSDPWLRKEIADLLISHERQGLAERLMADWAAGTQEPEMAYAYGLFLSQQDYSREAIVAIASIPKGKRTVSMEISLERLKLKLAIEQAVALYEKDPEKAVRMLQSYPRPKTVENRLSLAFAWMRMGDLGKARLIIGSPNLSALSDTLFIKYGEAVAVLDDKFLFDRWRAAAQPRTFNDVLQVQYYQVIADYELYGVNADYAVGNITKAHKTFQFLLNSDVPSQDEIAIRLVQTSHQLEDQKTFTYVTQRLIQRQPQLTYSQQLKLAEVLYKTDNSQDATLMLAKLGERSDGTAIDKWESLNIAMDKQQWDTAEKLAYQTLLADRQAKHPAKKEEQNLTLETMYLEADDYWLTRNVKADIDTLRAREDGHIKIGLDYGFREGENHELNVPLEARIPLSEYDGHLLFKLDYVQVDSGDQNFYDSNVSFDDRHTGAAIGVGWEAKDWRADIGTTPLNFLNTGIVGGIEKVFDIDKYTFRAVLSRRPETSTTLSYSGIKAVVPSTVPSEQEWGGVLKTGINLGLSWDDGGPYGAWSSAQFHFFDGKNTVDNTRFALMGGGYWKFVAEEDKRLSAGVSAFYMSYDKNLGEYAVGHGGYYSPQSYFSLSLPVSYYGRYQNTWAYSAYASVSHSWSELDVPYGLNGSEDSGSDFGYSLRLATEKRVSSKWYIGALVDVERSESYEPNHFQVYVKYTFNEGWQPIETPPDPVTLYADYY
ncbi:cellulose synthase subunit BcsC-related outer membrane protein [Photobacterium chitinilyticum]|uniref:Cellulose synthase n=1 Tax=Photobacterium chitinilyticum TaxID=2485123 RepID=A0A3S3UKQ1_9GAMM|nr:cellulose synthase subunit BcsC-related outer membrane protein [Photobacterium chitinilyticum]RWX54735.1 cellulose synthase [Photobacterium chitinilyticum]